MRDFSELAMFICAIAADIFDALEPMTRSKETMTNVMKTTLIRYVSEC